MYKRQGYLFYPKAEGKYPVVLCPPGAGIKTIKGPMRHKYYAEEGCILSLIHICSQKMEAQNLELTSEVREMPDTLTPYDRLAQNQLYLFVLRQPIIRRQCIRPVSYTHLKNLKKHYFLSR